MAVRIDWLAKMPDGGTVRGSSAAENVAEAMAGAADKMLSHAEAPLSVSDCVTISFYDVEGKPYAGHDRHIGDVTIGRKP